MSATPPHRKLVKHYHEPGNLHELTFSCYQRQPLLTNDSWREQLAHSIDAAGQECEMQLAAFVFMPEHVHLLVVPTGIDPAIDRYLARIKQPFSKWVKERLVDMKSSLINRLTIEERPGKTCFRFWQEGPGYDRNLTTPSVIEAAIQYIHLNPVRRGLVDKAVDWKWSMQAGTCSNQLDNNYQGCRLFMGCRLACSIEVESTLHWQSQWHPAHREFASFVQQRNLLPRFAGEGQAVRRSGF